ncbi:MAG: PFL family protein [Deltaproteobacteria bacterium]|nr:PFL family protein [Deltaproteobacteria bacterium]
MNYSPQEIIETIRMVQMENLDIRTVTMGISLLDCADADPDALCRKIYEKIMTRAGRLVPVCETIEKELGIPIVNKRISVTPIALVTAAHPAEAFVAVAETLDRAATAAGVNFIGGFSALVHKGFTKGDTALIEALPAALATTKRVCASVNLATSKAGINMDAVAQMGRTIKEIAARTAKDNSSGCARLVVFCNVPEDNPFMAGAFHGIGEPETVINVGVSGPGVVHSAVAKQGDADFGELAEVIKKQAFKITRMGELVGRMASGRLDTRFGIVDLSLAPTPAVGDSIAAILEEMGIEQCGAPGTTAALALLNDAVKKGGAMASSYVGGLSGAFIPVSEDAGMIAAVEAGAMSLEKLEAMTCVCSVGIDMVAVPGDTPAETISALIADEMAIGMVNKKTTAVRIIPAVGKKAGDRIEFGGLLGTAPVMAISKLDSSRFISRGGQIPSPIASLTN